MSMVSDRERLAFVLSLAVAAGDERLVKIDDKQVVRIGDVFVGLVFPEEQFVDAQVLSRLTRQRLVELIRAAAPAEEGDGEVDALLGALDGEESLAIGDLRAIVDKAKADRNMLKRVIEAAKLFGRWLRDGQRRLVCSKTGRAPFYWNGRKFVAAKSDSPFNDEGRMIPVSELETETAMAGLVLWWVLGGLVEEDQKPVEGDEVQLDEDTVITVRASFIETVTEEVGEPDQKLLGWLKGFGVEGEEAQEEFAAFLVSEGQHPVQVMLRFAGEASEVGLKMRTPVRKAVARFEKWEPQQVGGVQPDTHDSGADFGHYDGPSSPAPAATHVPATLDGASWMTIGGASNAPSGPVDPGPSQVRGLPFLRPTQLQSLVDACRTHFTEESVQKAMERLRGVHVSGAHNWERALGLPVLPWQRQFEAIFRALNVDGACGVRVEGVTPLEYVLQPLSFTWPGTSPLLTQLQSMREAADRFMSRTAPNLVAQLGLPTTGLLQRLLQYVGADKVSGDSFHDSRCGFSHYSSNDQLGDTADVFTGGLFSTFGPAGLMHRPSKAFTSRWAAWEFLCGGTEWAATDGLAAARQRLRLLQVALPKARSAHAHVRDFNAWVRGLEKYLGIAEGQF